MNRINIGDPSYWELRYQHEVGKLTSVECFDWYCPFDSLLPMFQTTIDETIQHKILIIGIGRSNIIEILYKRGYRDITAIDISKTIINRMQYKYSNYTGVELLVMDTRELINFSNNTFTIVIDKGCIDALFCSTDFIESNHKAINEIYRVLKDDGTFISISHASPMSRVPYFRSIRWAIDSYKILPSIGEGLTMYVMTKTNNEMLLSKKVAGGEAVVRSKASRVVSNLDQNMNKSSTTKTGENTGSITVTASAEALAELVAESANLDG